MFLLLLMCACSLARMGASPPEGSSAPRAGEWTLQGHVVAEGQSTVQVAHIEFLGLTANGDPLGNYYSEWLDPGPITTDVNGSFECWITPIRWRTQGSGWPPHLVLNITAPGYAPTSHSVSLSKWFSDHTQDVDRICLKRAGAAVIKVVDSAQVPVRGAYAVLSPCADAGGSPPMDPMPDWVSGPANESGWLIWDALPSGFYRLRVQVRELGKDVTLQVRAGECTSATCIATLPAGSQSVTGWVTTTTGTPVPNYPLVARTSWGSGREEVAATTDSDGKFVVTRSSQAKSDKFHLWSEDASRNVRLDLGKYSWSTPNAHVQIRERWPVALRLIHAGAAFKGSAIVRSQSLLAAQNEDVDVVTGCFPTGVAHVSMSVGVHHLSVTPLGANSIAGAWTQIEVPVGGCEASVLLPKMVRRKVHVLSSEGQLLCGVDLQLLAGPADRIANLDLHEGDGRDLAWHVSTYPVHCDPDNIVLLDRATTNRLGFAFLQCPETDGPLHLCMRDGMAAEPTVTTLPHWVKEDGVLEVRVPGAGVIVGVLNGVVATRVLESIPRDVLQQAQEYGEGRDPWGRSVLNALDTYGPYVTITRCGDAMARERHAAIGPDGRFRLESVPAGVYRCVVVPRGWQSQVDVVPFSSGTVHVAPCAESQITLVEK